MSQLTFFAEEPPASPSVSQDSEKDWMTHVATSCLPLVRLLQSIAPSGWFGRTSPVSCHLTGGGDFGAFLGMLGQLGYGFAYRIFDAQYFGVAQRRRRVFVVGCFGDWRSAAAVLFERHSLQGHPAPRREAGKGTSHQLAPSLTASGRGVERSGESRGKDPVIAVAGTLNANGKASGSATQQDAECGMLVPVPHNATSPALKARDHKGVSSDGDGDGDGAILVPMLAHSLRGEGFDASEDGTGRGTPLVPVAFDKSPFAVAYTTKLHNTTSNQAGKVYEEYNTSLDRSSPPPALLTAMQVRRLTPTECERLQGFPDGYTQVPTRGKPAADGPRYKALGNSWAVPNVRWIGERIDAVESLQLKAAA